MMLYLATFLSATTVLFASSIHAFTTTSTPKFMSTPAALHAYRRAPEIPGMTGGPGGSSLVSDYIDKDSMWTPNYHHVHRYRDHQRLSALGLEQSGMYFVKRKEYQRPTPSFARRRVPPIEGEADEAVPGPETSRVVESTPTLPAAAEQQPAPSLSGTPVPSQVQQQYA